MAHRSPEAASIQELSILVGLLPDPPTDGVPRLGDDVSGAAAGTARPGLQPPACRGMRWPVQECISWA